jgi:hypothetical protein
MNWSFRIPKAAAGMMVVLTVAVPKVEAATIYVGLGGQNGISTNQGAIGTLDPSTGAITVIGTPLPIHSISGLTFDNSGRLWGSTQIGGGNPPSPTVPPPVTTSDLIQINPITGAEISSVLIQAAGTPVSIADLAYQASTNTIFAIQSPNDANFSGTANLYTIATTGAATLAGNTGVFFGAIAFAPNGTLYMTSADLPITTGNCANGNDLDCALSTLNPATGAILTSVPAVDFYSALGISNTGVIWAGNGGGDVGGAGIGQFYPGASILDPATGHATFVGNTGTNFAGDIAFAPTPEPTSLMLIGIGVAALAVQRMRHGVRQGRIVVSH